MTTSISVRASIMFMAVLALCIAAYADSDYQTGTRGEGIGFAFSALADEPTGAYYNPAGAAFVKGWQAQIQYQQPTGFGLSMTDESPYGGLAGFNYYHENLGNIVLNSHQFGSFTDATSVTRLSGINLSYARLINGKFAAGAGMKYMMETNFSKRSVFDLDLGLTWRPVLSLSFAAVGENLVRSELTPEIAGFPQHLSRKFRLAGAYHLANSNYSGSFLAGWQLEQAGEIETNNTSMFNVGGEFWLGTTNNTSLGLRGGYTFGKQTAYIAELDYARWSAGASVNFDNNGRDIRIDYAIRSFPYESTEDFEVDHFVSVTYGWGGVPDYYGKERSDMYDLAKYRKEQTWTAPPIPGAEPARDIESGQTFSGQDIKAGKEGFAKLNLHLSATQLSTGANPRLIFYLKPDGLVRMRSWKLYIFSAKMKKWDDTKVDNFAVHMIEGKGLTPLTVVWNGQRADGTTVNPGKYYFVVVSDDDYGQKYMSKWQKFKIE